MDYKKHYDLLIETRLNRKITPGCYYEKHHIIPKSMGGDDSPNNLINLTAREHFLAHWLLWRIHNNKEMAFAFFAMTTMGKNQNIKSSRIYEEIKEARRPFIIEMNKKIHSNKKISPEHSELISVFFKGVPKNDIHRKKISESLKNKPKSDSHKEKLSKSLKDYDWSQHTERNKKISEKNSGSNNGRSRNVYMYNDNNILIETFETMKDCLNFVNKSNKFSKTTFYRYIIKEKKIDNLYFSFIKK